MACTFTNKLQIIHVDKSDNVRDEHDIETLLFPFRILVTSKYHRFLYYCYARYNNNYTNINSGFILVQPASYTNLYSA